MRKLPSYRCVLFVLLSVCFANTATAQHTLTIRLTTTPAGKEKENIYAAGNFNGWNPGDKNYVFQSNNGRIELMIPNLSKGNYEFKFTRGSWDKVASTVSGMDVANNAIQLNSDTTVEYRVEEWKDNFTTTPKMHTASAHVAVIDTAFYMPQLNRYRKIWIYLPPGYATAKKNYPVLYMHDGQNLFDVLTSGFGEWEIDESLDSLSENNSAYECIVVGIDNGPKRLNEYNPFNNERFGEGEGKAYVEFLVNTLKPYIDSVYRTRRDKNNTMIAGSSMGGLISYYAALAYPGVFGKTGVFSPAFWTATPGINELTDSLAKNNSGKFFFFMGGQEGDEYMSDMFGIMQSLATKSSALMYAAVDPDGKHNEATWRKWFPEFLKFMMADWTNYIINTADN